MTSKTVCVKLSADAEARPVAVLVQKASQYDSRVFIQTGDKKINAKSIMGMMSLGFTNGSNVVIAAEGEDEEEAVENLAQYLQSDK